LRDGLAVGVGGEFGNWEAGELDELGDFLVESHLFEEVGGAGFYFGFGNCGVGPGGLVLRLGAQIR